MKTLAKIAGRMSLFLIVFDLLTIILWLIARMLSLGDMDGGSTYLMWILMGALCGFFGYTSCGEIVGSDARFGDLPQRSLPVKKPGDGGPLVLLAILLLLGLLSLSGYCLVWRNSSEPSPFVPVSEPLTLIFFGSVFAASVLSYRWDLSEAKKGRRNPSSTTDRSS